MDIGLMGSKVIVDSSWLSALVSVVSLASQITSLTLFHYIQLTIKIFCGTLNSVDLKSSMSLASSQQALKDI